MESDIAPLTHKEELELKNYELIMRITLYKKMIRDLEKEIQKNAENISNL